MDARVLNRGACQGQFFVNFWEEWDWSLVGGLLPAPRLQEPLIEVAAGGIFWSRPVQAQLIYGKDTDELGVIRFSMLWGQ